MFVLMQGDGFKRSFPTALLLVLPRRPVPVRRALVPGSWRAGNRQPGERACPSRLLEYSRRADEGPPRRFHASVRRPRPFGHRRPRPIFPGEGDLRLSRHGDVHARRRDGSSAWPGESIWEVARRPRAGDPASVPFGRARLPARRQLSGLHGGDRRGTGARGILRAGSGRGHGRDDRTAPGPEGRGGWWSRCCWRTSRNARPRMIGPHGSGRPRMPRVWPRAACRRWSRRASPLLDDTAMWRCASISTPASSAASACGPAARCRSTT